MEQTPKNGFRTFLIILGTQGLSVFGSLLSYFALNVWLTQTLYPGPDQREALALAISIMSLAFMVPQILLTPVAGALADRLDRRRMMMLSDLGMAVVTIGMLALMATGNLTLLLVMILQTLSSGLSAFHQSALETSHAMLVPREQLPRANAMMQTLFSTARVFAPTVAAMLIALPGLLKGGILSGLKDGAVLAIGVDAVTFLISGSVLAFLPIPSPKREAAGPKRPSIWHDSKEGLSFLLARRPLLWLLSLFAVANLGMPLVGLFPPLLLKVSLAGDLGARGVSFEAGLALLGSAGSIGAVVGGLVVSSWGGLKRKRIFGVMIPMLVFAVALLALGLSTSLWLSVVAAFIINAHVPFVGAHNGAIWQSQVPRELQGRVFAVRRVVGTLTAPIATMIGGLLGGLFEPGMILAFIGGLFLLFLGAQFLNQGLMRVEEGAGAPLVPAAGD